MIGKKFSKILVMLLLALGLAFAAVACDQGTNDPGSGGPSSGDQPTLPSLSLSEENLQMEQYTSYILIASYANLGENVTLTWQSSNTAVATVDEGVVQAVGVGTSTITVTAGSLSDTCEVTVVASQYVPTLRLSQETARLLAGSGSVTITPSVYYKGVLAEDVDAGAYSYVSSDTEIAAVEKRADGSVIISAGKSGTATVTASVTYLGYELHRYISVTVASDITVVLTETTSTGGTLYTYSGGRSDYPQTLTLAAAVNNSSGAVDSPSITWESDNTAVADVTGGVVTVASGAGAGEAVIRAEYTVAETEEVFYDEFVVTVEKPVIELEPAAPVDLFLDLSDGDQQAGLAEIGLNESDRALTLKVYDGSAYSAQPGAVNTEIAEIAGGNVTFSFGLKECGERTIRFECDEASFIAPVSVITKVITTKEQLLDLRQFGIVEDVSTVPASGAWDHDRLLYKHYGYFILDNNIDLRGEIVQINYNGNQTFARYTSAAYDYGIVGGFDGRGHTILGGQYREGGLFGQVSQNAVIRNLSVEQADLYGANGAAIFGTTIYGKVDNVLLHIVTYNGGTAANASYIAGMAEAIYAPAQISNTVVYAAITSTASYTGAYCAMTPVAPVFTNCYAFSNVPALGGGTGNVAKYDYTAAAEDLSSYGLGDYFKIAGGKLVFGSAFIELADTEVELILGVEGRESYTAVIESLLLDMQNVTDDYTAVLTSDSDAVTIDGMTITAAQAGSAQITVTITYNEENYYAYMAVEVLDIEILDGSVDLDLNNAQTAVTVTVFDADALSQHGITLGDAYTLTDITGGASDPLTVGTVSGGGLGFVWDPATDYARLGERTLQLAAESGVYRFNVVIITKTLSTPQDILDITTYGVIKDAQNITEGARQGYFARQYAYFVLGDDIALGEQTVRPKNAEGEYVTIIDANYSASDGPVYTSGYGLIGGFDGRGHTITGGQYGYGGLFGLVAAGTVIKNFAVTGAQLNTGNSGVLSAGFFGTLDNVYVSYTQAVQSSTVGGVQYSVGGAIGYYIYNSTIRNVVVQHALGTDVTATASAAIANGASNANLYNVYAATAGDLWSTFYDSYVTTQENVNKLAADADLSTLSLTGDFNETYFNAWLNRA